MAPTSSFRHVFWQLESNVDTFCLRQIANETRQHKQQAALKCLLYLNSRKNISVSQTHFISIIIIFFCLRQRRLFSLVSVCWLVCLCVCHQGFAKATEWISMKVGGRMGQGRAG